VGKALQPTVIFIGDCEKLFKKKLKPEEKQVGRKTFQMIMKIVFSSNQNV
jgi:hypothetical protein